MQRARTTVADAVGSPLDRDALAVLASSGGRETLRAVAEAFGAGLLVQDAGGVVVEENARAREILGTVEGGMLGREPRDGDWRSVRAAERWSPPVERPYARALRTGSPAGGREGIPRRDGSAAWVDVAAIPLFEHGGGSPTGVASVLIDVSHHVATTSRLAAVERISHVGSWSWRLDSGIQWSPELSRLFGLEQSRTPGALPDLLSFVHLDDVDRIRPAIAMAVEDRQPFSLEMRVLRGDGAVRTVLSRGEPTILPDGRLLDYRGTMADITETREREAKLRDREEQLRVLIDTSADVIVRLDRDLRHVHINQAGAALAGLPASEIIGGGLEKLQASRSLRALWDRELRAVLATGKPRKFEWSVPRPGDERWLESHAAPEFGPDGTVNHLVVVSRDVTDRHRASEALAYQATHDGLTGLPNRRVLLDVLDDATEDGAPGTFAVLLLDVDRFKLVNDTLGHPTGDAVLVAVAQRLRAAVRDGDFISRLGGDEFVIVAPGVEDDDEARRVAERILVALRDPMIVEGQEFRPSVSIGIARPDGVAIAATEMLSRADAAMYLAKERGRDRLEFFDRDLQERVADRLAIDTALRHGLKRDELRVHYQPEVDLRTGEILAFEALVRWERPGEPLLPASAFVPVAEDSELIVELGRRVLAEVARDVGRWHRSAAGSAPPVRMNLSARDLNDPTLLDRVHSMLTGSGIPEGSLWFELTETSLMSDTPTVRANLMGLAALGVPIAIDDFGSGYSSLAYLKRLSVAAIKLDRGFVEYLPSSLEDAAIVEAVVALGHSLSVAVIAEGVETEAQRDALLALGCTRAQGFLFGAAIPESEIEALLVPCP